MQPDKPTVEIIAIGAELVMGRIQDTNSYWLCRCLAQLGAETRRITVIADDAAEIRDAVSAACERRADFIITTGGLGPTPDDLTVEAIAALLGRTTVVDEPTLQNFMARKGVTDRAALTPNLFKMATVPEGMTVHQSPAGWAPMLECDLNGSRLFVLPGPPQEMEALFTLYLTRLIGERCPTRTVALRVAVTMHESGVSPHLERVMAELPGTYLKAYVALRQMSGEPRLPLDVVATAQSETEARALLERAVKRLSEIVTAEGARLETAEE